MHIDYDSHTAEHYAAFRPELHLPILKKCLAKEKGYGPGLDVGCGTGHSSLALTHFCNLVVGVEPSSAMLQKAVPHPNIRYQAAIADHNEYRSDYFNVITFAGSLFYAKSQAVVDAISHAGKAGCQVVVYDYEILINELLQKLGVKAEAGENYDHQVDFSGLKTDHLKVLKREVDTTSIPIKLIEVAHLILADNGLRLNFRKKYPGGNLVEKLKELFLKSSASDTYMVEAKLYYSVYELLK